MTSIPQNGGFVGNRQSVERNSAGGNIKKTDKRFLSLESQLAYVPDIASRIAKKHWQAVEKEQYFFWSGILLAALLGVAGMYTREINWLGVVIVVMMIAIMAVVVAVYLRFLQKRFIRQWNLIAGDGELFKFLRDAAVVIGYPIEMGKPDEQFSTHLEIGFPDSVRAVETYLKDFESTELAPSEDSVCMYVPPSTLTQPPGGEAHRLYEIEYRGSLSQPLCIRVSKADRGADVVVSFPLRPASAESADRIAMSLQTRLQYRMIAAKILCDIRDITGLPPVPISAAEIQSFATGPQISRAI